MKTGLKVCFIVFLMLIYMYVCNIIFMPDSPIIIQGDSLNLKTILGLEIKQKENEYSAITASTNMGKQVNSVGKVDYSLKLFNLFDIKDITVNVIPKTSVIPLGNSIGMKLYTEGVMVVGMSEIEGKKPYEKTGIEEGDRIVAINDNKIQNTESLIKAVNSSSGKDLKVEYIKEDSQTLTTSITPVKSGDDKYKIGLWVRDAAAGVGTLTFYEPDSQMFAALGHGIVDIDTSKIIDIAKGELVTTKIISISKGKKGSPGEIRGSIESGYKVGDVYINSRLGIYGKISNFRNLKINNPEAIEVATREEIQLGKAHILCELETGKVEKYEIEIQKKYENNNGDNKSMLIKVTDHKLIEKTGGIIQGMSGAPIIQNGKFIGGVTHVLVNNPEVGYAVFADMMIKQMKTVN